MTTQGAQEIPEDASPTTISSTTQADPKLRALSQSDFRAYNRMADTMELFHNSFRQTWNQIYEACSSPSCDSSNAMSATRLISTCASFVSHLTMHHNIEETHIFPMLGSRMDAFKADAQTGPLEQHRQIHKGMDKLEEYMNQCKSGERSLRRHEVKEILDSFGPVLWTHLAEEVEQLGAENMRKHWSKQEIAQMPM